jgi:uncharacterized membrane protein
VNGFYALLKTAHVLSAAILFGAGLGTAFFCWFGSRAALRSGDLGALRQVLRFTVIADYCLTAPAVVFQVASGAVLMRHLGWAWVSEWSIAVYSLFVLTGACWVPVIELQQRLSREAARAPSIEALPARFHRWFQWWLVLGVPAFTAVVVLFYLMVAKPLRVAGI